MELLSYGYFKIYTLLYIVLSTPCAPERRIGIGVCVDLRVGLKLMRSSQVCRDVYCLVDTSLCCDWVFMVRILGTLAMLSGTFFFTEKVTHSITRDACNNVCRNSPAHSGNIRVIKIKDLRK